MLSIQHRHQLSGRLPSPPNAFLNRPKSNFMMSQGQEKRQHALSSHINLPKWLKVEKSVSCQIDVHCSAIERQAWQCKDYSCEGYSHFRATREREPSALSIIVPIRER